MDSFSDDEDNASLRSQRLPSGIDVPPFGNSRPDSELSRLDSPVSNRRYDNNQFWQQQLGQNLGMAYGIQLPMGSSISRAPHQGGLLPMMKELSVERFLEKKISRSLESKIEV